MDDEGDIEQKLIEKQMEETRASLSNKLEALENQVVDTVQTATDAVQNTTEAVAGTVESVKETVGEIGDKVSDTVHSVLSAFNLSRQVEERPWLMFGGAIGLGWLTGWYLPDRTRKSRPTGAQPSFPATSSWAAAPVAAAPPAEPKVPGWVSNQLSRVRGLAVGMVMGAVRDLARESLPESIRDRVTEEVDNLTPHLGGEVIHGTVLPESILHPEPSKPGEQSGSQSVGGEKYRAPSLVGEPGW